MRVNSGLAVPLGEVEIRTSRSSGPGGQHANVTASRVEAVFDIGASSALTDEQRSRLAKRHGARVTATAQDSRSQAHNREQALERLRERARWLSHRSPSEAAHEAGPGRKGAAPGSQAPHRGAQAGPQAAASRDE